MNIRDGWDWGCRGASISVKTGWCAPGHQSVRGWGEGGPFLECCKHRTGFFVVVCCTYGDCSLARAGQLRSRPASGAGAGPDGDVEEHLHSIEPALWGCIASFLYKMLLLSPGLILASRDLVWQMLHRASWSGNGPRDDKAATLLARGCGEGIGKMCGGMGESLLSGRSAGFWE